MAEKNPLRKDNTMFNKNLLIAALAGASFVAAGSAQAVLINGDFHKAVDNSVLHTGAAVIGGAGDVWNQLEPELSASATGLVDSDGNVTAVALDTVDIFSFYSTSTDFGSPLNDLMNDYAFVNPFTPSNAVGTATISGLDLNSNYTLYLFAVSDDPAGQNTEFTVAGSNEGTQLVTSNDGGPLVLGDDYVVFTGNTGGTGTIDITVKGFNPGGDPWFAAWNGFQLDVVPEPSSLALFGLGGLMIARRRRG